MDLKEAEQAWANISAPVLLIIRGDSSPSGDTWRDRAAAIPNHRSLVIEGAGHWVQHDQLAQFLQVVDGFLEEGT